MSKSNAGEEKFFLCISCNQVFTEKQALQTHLREHANLPVGTSKGNAKSSVANSKETQRKVRKQPNAKGKYTCPTCGMSFMQKSLFEMHQKSHHRSEQSSNLHCVACNINFHTKEELEKHVKNVHLAVKSQKFPCVLCKSVFNKKSELQSHFREHAGQSLSSTSNVGIQQPPVKTAESIPCDVCSEQFTSSTLAIQHKFRKHPDAPTKYHCPICGMLFTIKYLLDKHTTTNHTEESKSQVLKCDQCEAVFYKQEAFDYHVRTTHNRVMKLFQPVPTAPPSKKIKVNNAGDVQSVYFCHICGSEYIVKFNLQKHLELYHTEKERTEAPTDLIRCTVCDALFYNTKAYENHNISHRPDDLYVEDEQQRLRTISRVDQDFDVRRVLPLADKYIPCFKEKIRKKKTSSHQARKTNEDDEELSPPSSPGSSSGSDEEPLSTFKPPSTTRQQ